MCQIHIFNPDVTDKMPGAKGSLPVFFFAFEIPYEKFLRPMKNCFFYEKNILMDITDVSSPPRASGEPNSHRANLNTTDLSGVWLNLCILGHLRKLRSSTQGFRCIYSGI